VSEFRPYVVRARRLPVQAWIVLAVGVVGTVVTIVDSHGSVVDVGGVLVFAGIAVVGGWFVWHGLRGGVLLCVDADGIGVGENATDRARWDEVARVSTYRTATGDGEFLDGVTVELIDGRTLRTSIDDSPGYGARLLADAIAAVAPTVSVVDGPEPGMPEQFPLLAFVQWFRRTFQAYLDRKRR